MKFILPSFSILLLSTLAHAAVTRPAPLCQQKAETTVQNLLSENQVVKTSFLISAQLATDKTETVQVLSGKASDGKDQSIGYILVLDLADCSVIELKKGIFQFRD